MTKGSSRTRRGDVPSYIPGMEPRRRDGPVSRQSVRRRHGPVRGQSSQVAQGLASRIGRSRTPDYRSAAQEEVTGLKSCTVKELKSCRVPEQEGMTSQSSLRDSLTLQPL